MGNSYCKKDYSEGEITQVRLQKMKKNVAMASFYCLVSKIWKKNSILYCYKNGRKRPDLWCFLSAKN